MTIIQPHRNKLNFFASFLIIMTLASIVLGVFVYNQSVNFKHEIKVQNSNIKNLEVQNAELKNTLYQAIDSSNLESFKADNSLVIDNAPLYVKFDGESQLTINR